MWANPRRIMQGKRLFGRKLRHCFFSVDIATLTIKMV